MTDRRVDFTETESEDSSNDENVEPAENSHASSGLEGTFQVIARRSENEQAEHDLVQDVSQERGRKVGSKNDEYDIAEEFGNLSDFKQWFADKKDKWTRISRNTKKCAQDYYVFSSFATYFLNTWIDSPLKYWFEGASPVISNNSGLESANKNLKDRHVFRRQTPFTQFVEAAEKIPAEWSSQPELQTPAVDYKIDRDVLFKAFTLSKERRIMAHQGTRYILPATGTLYSAPECQSWIAAYVAGTNLDAYLTNWNDYKDTRFKYHAVKAREREAFLCTCQIGKFE
ncbi:hypothetical protein DdX_01066 [Ditylenchus destructor]|uniref:Transposase n=1 Tax=Ditylenchus destructor TaxID=166010 RepID=A0AAD4NET2_9BILA|nr:hypothetical protein DdX_01066 [Ditylenchus destructor]